MTMMRMLMLAHGSILLPSSLVGLITTPDITVLELLHLVR